MVDKVVPAAVDQVRAQNETKDLITIMTKDMEIIIVFMVVIRTIVAMVTMIILGITIETMNMARDMQTAVASRTLRSGCLERVEITKAMSRHTKRRLWKNLEEIAKVSHLAE